MKNTDFTDRDLPRGSSGSWSRRGNDVDSAPQAPNSGGGIPGLRSVADENTGRLAKYKAHVDSNMIDALDEIERLRLRQQELESEKRDLEELRRKQEEYERGKRDVVEHLNEGIIALEKKEVQSAQLTELLIATRSRFREALAEIESIDEEDWPENQFREELYKALVIVDDARMEYNKALAKIEVIEGSKEPILERNLALDQNRSHAAMVEHGFGYWMKVGVAVSLPFLLLMVLVLIVYMALRFANWV